MITKKSILKSITHITLFSFIFSIGYLGNFQKDALASAQITSEDISILEDSYNRSVDDYNESVNDYNAIKKIYDRGSLGFFESVQAESAIKALTESSIASYTKIGDENDATSLENMKSVFENITSQIDSSYFPDTEESMTYIDKCNYLREKNNVSKLQITDYLMAAAQADCNYSDKVIGHAGAFNVGENLAWNYGSDPFYQWYDEEYAIYLKDNNAQFSEIGHYLNIINSMYNYTGFAICTRKSMYGWNTYGQTFSYKPGSDQSLNEESYTVNEYKERFMNYYNSIVNPMNKAKNKMQSAKNKMQNAKNALDSAINLKAEQEANSNTDIASDTLSGSDKDTDNNSATSKNQNTNKTSTVNVRQAGSTYTISSNTAALTSTSKSKTSIKIPSTITLKGKKYKVTSIPKNAFKNNKKLKKITIGKNIKKIGKNAFYGCKKLKKIIFKTKILKSIGKNAFKKINKKAKFIYPKGKKAKYKKMIKKSNK